MALISWDDEEKKKRDELTAPGIAHIASVQSGAWQPAASGADSAVATDDVTTPQQGGIFGKPTTPAAPAATDNNYLLSDQKAQVDAQKTAQRNAEIEQARQDSIARAEAAKAAKAAEEFQQGQVTNQQGQRLNVDAIKKDDGWKKYYGDTFKKEKDSLDFWGRLMDGGQASKRAEVMARNKYASELINKAYDENGNTIDPNAALKAKGITAYNSALAQDNSTRAEALGRAIGATKDNQDHGFLGRLKSAINAEKQMSIYDAIVGADDGQKTNINDLGRFGGNLIQGLGTMIPIGAKELEEAGTGHGTNAETGFEDKLTAAERVGRGISGGLNVVTPFVGGSGKLLESLTTKVAEGTATAAEKTLLQQMTSKILLPAIEQGGIGTAQSGAEYFGNGKTLTDENGHLDMNKVKDFAKQTGEAGAMGFAGGALMSGAGMGINKLRSRGVDIPTLTPDELTELETGNSNVAASELAAMQGGESTGQSLQSLENGDVTPVQQKPVADGVAQTPDELTPVAPEDRAAAEAKADGISTAETPAAGDPVLTPVSRAELTADMLPEGSSRASTADSPNELVNPDETAAAPLSSDGIATPDVPAREAAPVDALPADVTPAKATEAPAVADGTVLPADVTPVKNVPVVPTEQKRMLAESKAGKSQAEDSVINQKIKEADAATPAVDNVPDMGETPDGNLTPAQSAERFMPKLADNSDLKSRAAQAVGMGKDTQSPIRDILTEGGVKPKKVERVASQFDTLDKQVQEYNRLTDKNRSDYADGGTDALDAETSKARSRAGRELGITTRRLMNEIKHLEAGSDKQIALVHHLADIIGTRNASVLSSAGLIERNVFQEITANLKLTAKNPIKMVKSTFENGNILKDTAKSELSHWGDAPRNPIEAVKYVVGNTYRTAMIPTTALANVRRGAVRDELTRWAFQELEGRKVSSAEAHKLSGTAGNEMEALVNTVIGADNGMTNRGQAKAALDSWKEYMRTGDDGSHAQYLNKVEEHTSLADQMIAGLSKEDAVKGHLIKQMGQLIFPFVRTAKNLAVSTVQQDLNPFAKSLLDEIRADQRGNTANAINTIKSKLVDYGIMSGAAALASSGALVYNDGDEVDKPRGWSLKVGDNHYVPVRATSIELPVALAGTAQHMASDIAHGKARDWKYYAGMVTGSLPYIDQINTTTGAVDSLMGASDGSGDKGYAAKSYGVNMAKSFVPFSNNGVQAYVAGKEGDSLNAKTVYDKNMLTWFKNSVQKNYDPNFYNGLKDSRDNAGRVRTVDNQGVVSNKTINDMSTKEFNQRVTDLVNYGREAGLGNNTQDMFNTYDTGKNNNFKSVQDSITFLDAPTMNGKSSPDAATKLQKNGKLSGLSQQMRDGFYGDSGSDLLQLDGQDLKSDVSMPTKDGSKNTKMPLSMQSIKNAIAQTDLPKEESDKLYDISNQSTDLYSQLKSKSITYDQYSAAKAKLADQQVSILSGSKNYAKMVSLFDELDQTGFFKPDGLGATRSGQTYLWNSLNALLGSKGATPAANYPDDSKSGFTPWGNRGTGRSSNAGGNLEGGKGVEFSPVKARQMAGVTAGQYTPFKAKVKLGNAIKKDRSQNYSDMTF